MNILVKICFFVVVFCRCVFLTADQSIIEYHHGSHFIRACSFKKNNNDIQFSKEEIRALFAWLQRNEIIQKSKRQKLYAYKQRNIICLHTRCLTPYKKLLTTEKRKLLFKRANHMIAIGEIINGVFYDCTDDEDVVIPRIIS